MNVELLNRVKAHILEEPKRFYMPEIVCHRPAHHEETEWGKRFPSCGTIGCFAGWVCVLSGKEGYDITSFEARELVGLDSHQAHRLFYGMPETWSNEDKNKLWSGDGSPETAALAARRIDEFIASDGAI